MIEAVAPPRGLKAWPVMAVTVAFAAAQAAQPYLPGAQDYITSKGIVPSWEPWVAAAFGVLTALTLVTRTVKPVLGWITCALLLWAAIGIVFDAFRAFFWATGIPAGEFALVDWPGFLTRTTAFIATITLGRAVLLAQRAKLGVCIRCGGRSVATRSTAWLGYSACALAAVYPAVKYYWWLGGSFGRPPIYTEGFPVMETALLVGGVVLALALVRPWGRRVPRAIPLIAGWGLAAALVLQGMIPLFATINHLLGGPALPFDPSSANSWMITVVYGGWALFGVTLVGATYAYQQRTRRTCLSCGS